MSEKKAIYKTEAMADVLAENGYIQEAVEMLGKGYHIGPPKKALSIWSGFTPAPDEIIKRCDFVTALVWGKVWRYCQGREGICRAKLERLAGELGMSERTIIRHLGILVDYGFLEDTTPDLKNKPHIYADTGKIRIGISVEATVTESHPTMTESHSAMTESHREGDRESLEDSNKKVLNKENNNEFFSSSKKRPTPEGLPEPTGDLMGDWLKMDAGLKDRNRPVVDVIEALVLGFPYNFPHFGENKAFDRVAKLIAADGRDIKIFISWAKTNKRDPHWYLVKPDTLWGDWPQAFAPKTEGLSVYDRLKMQLEEEKRNGSTV